MDPAPPSVGERFPVLISSMHQTAEEVTHTHRSAAQPGRVAVVSGGSGVESVGKPWGLILSWEPSVRCADCRGGGQLERQKKKEDDAAAKIQARYRGKQATVKVAVRPTDPRCPTNRVVLLTGFVSSLSGGPGAAQAPAGGGGRRRRADPGTRPWPNRPPVCSLLSRAAALVLTLYVAVSTFLLTLTGSYSPIWGRSSLSSTARLQSRRRAFAFAARLVTGGWLSNALALWS